MASVRSFSAMHFHMIFKIIASMENTPTPSYLTRKLFTFIVLFLVTQTIVLADKLLTTDIAYKRFEIFVSIEVGHVVKVTEKGALAQSAFVGHRTSRLVSPLVQLHVPFCGEHL